MLGESFVTIAFTQAKVIDPVAVYVLLYAFHTMCLIHYRRYINDYNLDSNNAKTQGMVTLVKKVNAANPGLIQGCGTQGHLSVGLFVLHSE